MNVARRFVGRNLACALGVMVVGAATLFASCPALAQTGSASPHARLESFAGTWTAKNAGENAPYLILKLTEKDGKLAATMSHGKFRVGGRGRLTGVPEIAPETPLSNPTVTNGVLSFVWSREDSAFSGAQAAFLVEGTQVARLVFVLSAEQAKRIMAENPDASGFNPVIEVRRESRGASLGPGKAAAKEWPDSSPDWRVTLMARIINRAEVLSWSAHGRYADYPTLVRAGQVQEAGSMFTVAPGNLQSETDPLPGYELRLRIAPDSATYQLSIQKKVPAGCGPGVFSDERGILFEGRNPGCRAE